MKKGWIQITKIGNIWQVILPLLQAITLLSGLKIKEYEDGSIWLY